MALSFYINEELIVSSYKYNLQIKDHSAVRKSLSSLKPYFTRAVEILTHVERETPTRKS